MADRDPDSPDPDVTPERQTESQGVESWYPHPSHAPVSSHHTLTSWERRKPENAQIRRWMDLADQALKEGNAEEKDSTPSS